MLAFENYFRNDTPRHTPKHQLNECKGSIFVNFGRLF